MTLSDLDSFAQGYCVAVEFTWTGDDGEDTLPDSCEGWAPETLAKVRRDCDKFQEENSDDLAAFMYRVKGPASGGADFLFTRNGHGSGFWDRDLAEREEEDEPTSEEVKNRLSEAARAFGEVYHYLGDDGLIYC